MRQKVNVDQTFLPKETLEWITKLFLNQGLFKEWSPTLKERLDRMMCHCTPCSYPQSTGWHGSGQLRGHMKGNSTLRNGHLHGCIIKTAAHIWVPSEGVQAEVCTVSLRRNNGLQGLISLALGQRKTPVSDGKQLECQMQTSHKG